MANSLDDAQTLIESIEKEHADNNSIATMLTNTLESNIATVFGSKAKFIYELLQNADDEGATHIQFKLVGTNLVVSHNGAKFRDGDVKQICNNAKPGGAKSTTLEKTGYKGVGFKAVFCISTKVTIVSRPFCFRFDKLHWTQQQEGEGRYPWPIIPIWTDSQVIDAYLSSEEKEKYTVHFILEDIYTHEIRQEMDAIFHSMEILLMLRHISSVSLTHSNTVIEKTRQDDASLFLLTRRVNNVVADRQYWTCKSLEIPVPQSVRDDMAGYSPAECPEKIKTAHNVSITFAAQFHDNALMSYESSRMFCYLPTQVNSGLPFLVNGDFLLTQDRMSLLDKGWNVFLLKKIGKEQFTWFAELAQNKRFRQSILCLLRSPKLLGIHSSVLQQAYFDGFRDGVSTIAFIPSHNNLRLLTLGEVVVDESKFFSIFSEEFLDPGLQDAKGSKLAAYDLLAIDNIVNFGVDDYRVTVYRFIDLLDSIELYLQQYTTDNIALFLKVLVFFMRSSDTQYHIESLRTKKILVTTDNKWVSAQECYFPEDELNLAQQFSLNIISQQLANSNVRLFIRDGLQVGTLSKINVIRNYIIQGLLQKNGINANNTIALLRLIYVAYCGASPLLISDFDALKQFKVLTETKTLVCIAGTYIQFPEQAMLGVPGNVIMSSAYWQSEQRDQAKMGRWRELLLRMGAQAEVRLKVNLGKIDPKTQRSVESVRVQEIRSYLDSQNNGSRKSFDAYYVCLRNYHREKLVKDPSDPILESFVTFDFLHILTVQNGYYHIFWQAFILDWSKLRERCKFNKNLSKKRNEIFTVQHYLSHYLQNNACIKIAGKNTFAMATKVFSPTLFKDFGLDTLPVDIADIPCELTPEQIQFIGLKTSLTLGDCLSLLGNEACRSIPAKVTHIYRWLLKLTLSVDDQRYLSYWLEQNRVLSNGHTMEFVRTLQYVTNQRSTPYSSQYLCTGDLNHEESQQLAALLGVESIVPRLLVDQTQCKSAPEVQQKTYQFLCEYLPIFIVLEAKNSGRTQNEVLTLMSSCLQFKFYSCESITLLGVPQSAVIEENVVYVSERWRKIKHSLFEEFQRKFFHFSERVWSTFITIVDKPPELLDHEFRNLGVDTKDYYAIKSSLQRIGQQDLPETPPQTNVDSDLFGSSDTDVIDIVVSDLTTSSSDEDIAGPSTRKTTATVEEIAPDSDSEELLSVTPPNEGKSPSNPSTPEEGRPVSPDGSNRGKTVPVEIPIGTLNPSPAKRAINKGKKTMRHGPSGASIGDKEKAEIGRIGEESVYNKLKEHYVQKYVNKNEDKKLKEALKQESFELQDTEEGFVVLKNKQRYIACFWQNKKEESYQPYDMEITKKDKPDRKIEVKATRKVYPTKSKSHFSRAELQVALDPGNNYRLYKVYGVQTGSLVVKKITQFKQTLFKDLTATMLGEGSFIENIAFKF